MTASARILAASTLREDEESFVKLVCRPPEIASGTPIPGIQFAWTNDHSTYVELYGAGLLAAANTNSLRKWNRFFLAVEAFRSRTEGLKLESNAGGLRLQWNADAWLNCRLWKSPNLTGWALENLIEPLDGEIILPYSAGDSAQYYRIEVLAPVQ